MILLPVARVARVKDDLPTDYNGKVVKNQIDLAEALGAEVLILEPWAARLVHEAEQGNPSPTPLWPGESRGFAAPDPDAGESRGVAAPHP